MKRALPLFDLRRRTAVVTGGGGILGPRHAEVLAAAGARVILVDRERGPVEHAARSLGPKCTPYVADIARKTEVETMARRLGTIDVLVNNAAGKSRNIFAPFADFPLEDWDEVIRSNLTTMFLCCQVIGSRMAARGRGSIINLSSIYGVVGPDQRIYRGSRYEGRAINTPAVYSATKAGVIGLTRYLATYWAAQGVRVNAITPGGVESGQNDVFRRKYSARVPMRRMARPNELQGAILLLASDASSYMTGHNLVVDGGWTAW